MNRGVVIFVSTVLMLVASLAVADKVGWSPLEHPPRQGEALDNSMLLEGHAVHSEAAVRRTIREPQNTWSNLAFIFAGSILAAVSISRISRFTGWALLAVGIGSFLYHASASRTFRNLDVGAMYSLFFVLAAISLSSLSRSLRPAIEARAGIIALGAVAFGFIATLSRNFVFLGVKPLNLTIVTGVAAVFFCIALVARLAVDRRASTIIGVGSALGLFAISVFFQIGDRPGSWLCAPNAPIQGHALWHLFAATALFIGIRTIDTQIHNKSKNE